MASTTAIVTTGKGPTFPATKTSSVVNTKKSVITGVQPLQVLGTFSVQKAVSVPSIPAGGSTVVKFTVTPTGLPLLFTLSKGSSGQITNSIALHSTPLANTHVSMPVTTLSFGRGAGSWQLLGGVEYSGPLISVAVTIQNLSSSAALAAQQLTFLAQGGLYGTPGA
jgi:hypothetical protein